jgi:hypothetical protein
MSFLTRLLRKPIIKNGYSFLGQHTIYSMELIKKSLFKKNQYAPLPHTYTSITVSNHAFERWNERIGPPVGYQDLTNLLNQLIHLTGRISIISDRRGLIDSEILFIYQQKGNCIHITTFYGRLSLQPALRNIRNLKAYQLMQKERIILKLNDQILAQQQLPIVPIEYIEFEGRTISYSLQKYRVLHNNSEKILIFLSETTKLGEYRVIVIDPVNFFDHLLNHSVLYVLFKMGYREFVLEHLQYFKPDAVIKALEKYEEFLKRRFELKEKVRNKREKTS